jgi:transcriptional regulator with XRE-family HTH domain
MGHNTVGMRALLPEILKHLRLRKSITQLQLAEHLDKPQSFVSKFESGERRLDVIEFIMVCRALGEDPAEVIQSIEKGENSESKGQI